MAFPKTLDLNYYRGDTFQFNIELKNSDGTDFAVNTFETFSFKIADKRGSGATQTTASAERSDPAGVLCTITPTVGRTLSAGQYFYDVQITDTTPTPNVIYTVLTGMIKVTDDISGAL
jgi:hypothetical protein